MIRIEWSGAFVSVAAALLVAPVWAQACPERPVKLVVPFAGGGGAQPRS